MSRRETSRPRSGSREGRPPAGLFRFVLPGGLGLLAAALALAACGGSNPPSSSTSAHVEDAVKFSKCMRENGVKDFPDPKVSANGGTELSFNAAGVAPKTMEAAQQTCQHFQEEGEEAAEASPQQKAESEEAVQEFAKCMREHGIEVKTKVSPGGGVSVGVGAGGAKGGSHGESPALKAASEACQGLMPGSSSSSSGGG